MKEIIRKLTEKNKTISTMESCTGGAVASAITDIEGASEVIKFSAVTYSNEFKIKMGVNEKIIVKYSVYSMETAHEMSHAISSFSDADYGVGITGKLNREDPKNKFGDDNKVYISVYDREKDKYYDSIILVTNKTRKQNKKQVINEVKQIIINNI